MNSHDSITFFFLNSSSYTYKLEYNFHQIVDQFSSIFISRVSITKLTWCKKLRRSCDKKEKQQRRIVSGIQSITVPKDVWLKIKLSRHSVRLIGAVSVTLTITFIILFADRKGILHFVHI